MKERYTVKTDSLDSPEVKALLAEHLTEMLATSPAESVHALDAEKLKQPDITFYSAWQGENLLACLAVKKLSPNTYQDTVELKSMRTAINARGKGVARFLLTHVLNLLKQSNVKQVYLETGTAPYFLAAHQLYQSIGFNFCQPFADYKIDENSAFMQFNLNEIWND